MMEQQTFLETTEALQKLGFVPDASVWAEDGEGLLYDFGNMKLSASRLPNRYFVEIVLVSGIYVTPRTMADIEIQLPLKVLSIEQCAAFLAWGIGERFIPLKAADWLETGRNNFDQLPWIKERKLYEARPKCLVERDWLRLALRDLRALQPSLREDMLLTFSFQSQILSVHTSQKLIPLPAVGEDWKSQYEITAGNIQNFPKRLNNKMLEISVWNNFLCFSGWRYPIVKINNPEV